MQPSSSFFSLTPLNSVISCCNSQVLQSITFLFLISFLLKQFSHNKCLNSFSEFNIFLKSSGHLKKTFKNFTVISKFLLHKKHFQFQIFNISFDKSIFVVSNYFFLILLSYIIHLDYYK